MNLENVKQYFWDNFQKLKQNKGTGVSTIFLIKKE